MSFWEHRKPVHRARAVDVSEVARAAVVLLDEGGLRGLTVRAVAGRLNVAPASLYSRVESVADLHDLALDHALGDDRALDRAMAGSDLHVLMLAFYRHLARHRWACHVIGMRAPRGPHYLGLSERMVVLLEELGADDPLGAAYTLSNFVIGSAMTASMSEDERSARVDPAIAPHYARLHAEHAVDAESILAAGLAALRSQLHA